MANLLRRAWSASDFWDKEENKRQRDQFAQQAQQQQQNTVRSPSGLQIRPGGANDVPNFVAPKQSALDKIKDIVNPNTEADKFRRAQGALDQVARATNNNPLAQKDAVSQLSGNQQLTQYRDNNAPNVLREGGKAGIGLGKMGAEIASTPFDAGRLLAANHLKDQQQADAARKALSGDLQRGVGGILTTAPKVANTAYFAATDASQKKLISPTGGLFNQGTLFPTKESYQRMYGGTVGANGVITGESVRPKELAKRTALTTPGLAADLSVLAGGAKGFYGGARPAPNASLLQDLAKQAPGNFALGSSGNAAQQYEQTGRIDPFEAIQAGVGTAFGGAAIQAGGYALGRGFNRATRPLDETGSIPINNPFGAKTGLEINKGVPTVEPLKVRNVSGAPLERPLKINDPYNLRETPLQIRNNTGTPLVGEGLSGAAQQSWLSKARNRLTSLDENGGGVVDDSPVLNKLKKLTGQQEYDAALRAESAANLKKANVQITTGRAYRPGDLPLPRRSESPLRASMTEDEFFQRFNPNAPAEVPALARSSAVPNARPSLPDNTSIDTPRLRPQENRLPQSEVQVPSANRTPRQLEIKDSVTPFNADKAKIVEDYAAMLKDVGEGNGVDITADGRRVSNNFRGELGSGRMTKQAWLDEAQRQIDSGKAPQEIIDAYKSLDDPEFQSLVQNEDKMSAPGSVGDKFETDRLEGPRQKIAARSGESNIPVRKMTREGDAVTAENVNPNIKAGEKRYAVDPVTGDLIPDKKGATSLFTDNEGRVTGFRIGNETFNAKQLGDLSDVNGYGSSMATMRRNVERGFGKETGAKVNEFLVDHQQQQATKMIERQVSLKKGLQEQADALGINFGGRNKKAKQVSADIQNYGEKQITKAQLVEKYGKEYADKIVQADGWFKSQYDALLTEMNDTLTRYGYDPVPRRKNYYTHFMDESVWRKFGLQMQEIKNLTGPTLQDSAPEASRGLISNKLAGQSEFTTPNKRFNRFALRRTGDTHTADAFKAFETYLSPTLNNIYMTPSIARARVLTRAIAQEADIAGKDANRIIIQTKEWGNRLAGKSNRFDRPIADTAGGQMYLKATNWVQRKAGANTIVGNLSTAVMQPILLAQTSGKSGLKNTILAAMQEMSTAHGSNAPIRQSEFMRRRYADVTNVTAGKGQRVAEKLNKPLEVVEETAARISWNAAHNDALSKGLKGKAAIKYADVQTEKTLAGRSIGERPELYESKAASPITMYQLEVNNFWQQFGKEMTKGQAAKTLVAAYALNLLLQQATGKQVGFNPIDAAIDSYQETQKEEKGALDKAKAIGQRFAGEVVDNTPLVGPIANVTVGDKNLRSLLGPTSNAGRYGVGSPLSAVANTTKIGGIPIPQNLILPFGGGQAKKTYTGAEALIKGKMTNKDGETTVDVPRTPANIARGLAFGPSAIPEVGKYYDNSGKKKVDQVFVPNQKGSLAGTQSLQGLTKDQQEMLRDLPEADKQSFYNKAVADNKKGRSAEQEVVSFKKNTSKNEITTSEGKIVRKVGNDYKTYKNQKEADIDAFKNSTAKTKVIGDTYYYKNRSGDVQTKNKFEYEYDKTASSRKLNLDRAVSANDLGKWSKLADEEYNALEKLKGRYDPETEQDKIDAITLKQENLQEKADKYAEQGYIRKGKGGKGKKGTLDLLKTASTTPDFGKPKKSSLSAKRVAVPTFKTSTPRVARRGKRNTGSVSSRKTYLA